MRFEIVVAAHPPPADVLANLPAGPPDGDPAPTPRTPSSPRSANRGAGLRVVAAAERGAVPGALDILVDGANVTANVRETHGAWVLRDLGLLLVELGGGARNKGTVRFYDEPWEMCVARFGKTAYVSVYRAGKDPQVAVYDRAVPFDDVVVGVREAIEKLIATGQTSAIDEPELLKAAEQLRRAAPLDLRDSSDVPESVTLSIEPDPEAPISFGADFTLRSSAAGHGFEESNPDPIERSDLHALLFKGRVRALVRGRIVDLGDSRPLLVAERLADAGRRAFDAWERGLGLHVRSEAAGILLGVRVNAGGELALTLGAARRKGNDSHRDAGAVHTFPALAAPDLLDAALTFGRSLVRAILRHDRAQASNLRLEPLRLALRDASESLRASSQSDSKVNPSPEPYRAFAEALDEARPKPPSLLPAARLRYQARWRAIVPGIDLRATYLCGDRIVAGSPTQMWALDRATGQVIWRSETTRGTSVVTPRGIARLTADGMIRVYDLGTGEVALRARIVPRVGGPVAGAVVHLPGLPKLIVVTEGAHHLVAIDLTSGEPRWRWSWGAGRPGRGAGAGAPRIKRAGRLAYFTCGDAALTALDVMTGDVVWRIRDRLRFYSPPTVAHDALFVLAGGFQGVARLYCLDPYSGGVRWTSPVGDTGVPCVVQGSPVVSSSSVAAIVRQKTGAMLPTFRREDGTPLAGRPRVVAPNATSWMAVDDSFIGNAPTGELLAIDSDTGELRWRHLLGASTVESDIPRRLEPILRGGVLFVPHTDVMIVRPRDGKVIGSISPVEVIPDLLRVDERCDVYAAEESGHLISFGALPRLSLVKD